MDTDIADPTTAESAQSRPCARGPLEEIRELILAGRLLPGEKLREVELATRFATSRTPVREALIALEREGLVSYHKNRGFSVRQLVLRELYESYEMRAMMEGYASGLIARRGMSAHGIERLRACVAEVDAMLAGEPIESAPGEIWRASNLTFHRVLMCEPDNSLLKRTHENVGQVLLMHDWVKHNKVLNAHDTMARFNRDHSPIIDAIESRDSARAEFLTREHIMSGMRQFAEYLRSTGIDYR